MSELIIDYSAHTAFDDNCPGYWWELYVNKRRKRWPRAQRDDALCLGSLVHEGLRRWQEDHVIEIPEAVITECTPTADCLQLATELVWGYTQHYPSEQWPLVLCEEPVLFPLREEAPTTYTCQWPQCGSFRYPVREAIAKLGGYICVNCRRIIYPIGGERGVTGLAKIDSYFRVATPTEIQTGLGEYVTLSPGWWIHEYKTKSPYTSMALYMQGWEMGMQACYQLIALAERLGEKPQGILVNVLEKPRRYIPKRTCKACKETLEFYTYLPTGDGGYSCPLCGHHQALTPLKEVQPTVPPSYSRIIVTRTAEQLAHARQDMLTVGQRMIAMEAGGLHSEPWHRKNCVNEAWRRPCDFFASHNSGVDTREDNENYTDQGDYRGLTQIEL